MPKKLPAECICYSCLPATYSLVIDLKGNQKKSSYTILTLINKLFSEEEEVDKMMEQKMKEEEERKRTKEIEERMSLEETKEQV